MEKLKFVHKVSKGARFNQIYIPKSMELNFQAGDLVEVTLLEKSNSVYYSKTLPKLSEFKENLIKNIFSELDKFREIRQIFIIGSFLTQKQDYNDIDIILISEKNLEKEIYKILINKFELKFHVMSIPEDNFKSLQKYCPMTRSMLYYFVSNKKFNLPKETELNQNHIKFLLMMPEDLLTINLKSRVFYDSIRRLLAIERFLENRPLNPFDINKEIKNILGEKIVIDIRNNENMNDDLIKKLRNIIKSKLSKINKIINKNK
jgi:REP element-mobilizing transposase RayT